MTKWKDDGFFKTLIHFISLISYINILNSKVTHFYIFWSFFGVFLYLSINPILCSRFLNYKLICSIFSFFLCHVNLSSDSSWIVSMATHWSAFPLLTPKRHQTILSTARWPLSGPFPDHPFVEEPLGQSPKLVSPTWSDPHSTTFSLSTQSPSSCHL